MPTPVSLTVISIWFPARCSRVSMRPPSFENLTAFESKFQIACRRRPASPSTTSRRAPITAVNATPFNSAHGADNVYSGLKDTLDIDRLGVELQIACDDPRRV